jgi:hypothetical protein
MNEEGSPHVKEKDRIKEESAGKEKNPNQEKDPDQEKDAAEEKRRNKIYRSGYQNTTERTGHSH